MKHALSILAMVLLFGSGTPVDAEQGDGGGLTAQDYIEIQQLYARYAHTMDLGDAKGYADTFTSDGVFVVGDRITTGRAELTTLAEGFYSSDGTARHWNSQVLITPTADGATGSCYLLLVNTGVQPVGISISGIYQDKVVKTAAGWRFRERVFDMEMPTSSQ